MKIITPSKINTKYFKEVENGEVFKVNNVYFMKFNWISTGDCRRLNAVCLSNGHLFGFNSSDEVELCDAELQIKG